MQVFISENWSVNHSLDTLQNKQLILLKGVEFFVRGNTFSNAFLGKLRFVYDILWMNEWMSVHVLALHNEIDDKSLFYMLSFQKFEVS